MKELLVYAAERQVSILVPKRRGKGYLKVPFGHHNNAALSNLSAKIGYDLFGLDGSLDVQTGYIHPFKADELLARIMLPIAAHYEMNWKRIGADEFWARHPIST